MTPIPDLLVPWDDTLVNRLERCTTCGSRQLAHTVMWTMPGSRLTLACAQCARCAASDPKGCHLKDLMQARYSERGEP